MSDTLHLDIDREVAHTFDDIQRLLFDGFKDDTLVVDLMNQATSLMFYTLVHNESPDEAWDDLDGLIDSYARDSQYTHEVLMQAFCELTTAFHLRYKDMYYHILDDIMDFAKPRVTDPVHMFQVKFSRGFRRVTLHR